jgi:predicted phosphodiesterase
MQNEDYNISPKKWIEDKVIELDNNREEIYKLYQDFLEETGSQSSLEGFKSNVRKYSTEMGFETYSSAESDSKLSEELRAQYLRSYKEVDLLTILEDAVIEKGTNLSYSDISDIAIKSDIPVDAFYVCIVNFKDKLKLIYDSNLTNIQNDINDRKVKQKLKVYEKELEYYRDRETNYSVILDTLEEIIEVYTPYKRPEFRKSIRADREAVLLISDTHNDEWVDSDEVMGVNEYNPDIARQRLDKLFSTAIENAKELQTDVLNIFLLGDMVSGIIHQELLMNSQLGISISIFQMVDYIAQWVRTCTKYFREININAVVGNHGRMFVKPSFKKKAQLNYDYILYEVLRRETKNLVKSFTLPDSPYYIVEVQGVKILNLHGDTIRGGSGLSVVPGNLSRDISLLGGTLRQSGINFDVVNMGHFHTFNVTKSFDGSEIIMNGSLIGTNEYSLGAIKKGEKASQTFYIIEKDLGIRFIDKIVLN